MTTCDARVNTDTMNSDGPPRTLVVPLDGSDYSTRAVPIAATFAGRFGAGLLLMTTPMAIERTPGLPAWLERTLGTVGNVQAHAEVSVHDEPVQAITEAIQHADRPAVCMATHSRGVIGSTALGSVTQGVVRMIGVPVLLVGRHCGADMRVDGPVVVCHDGSPAAGAILAPALAWARGLGTDIVLLHISHPLDVESARAPRVPVESALEFLGTETKVELVRSSFPAGAIRDFAHEVDACVVAMSTHGRTGLARAVLGSVTTWVTRESHCPVLVNRPATLDASAG